MVGVLACLPGEFCFCEFLRDYPRNELPHAFIMGDFVNKFCEIGTRKEFAEFIGVSLKN